MTKDRHKQPGIIIRLEPSQNEALRNAAEERGVSMTWLGTRLIAEGLTRLLPPDEFLFRKDDR
jgi:hypothetical protein